MEHKNKAPEHKNKALTFNTSLATLKFACDGLEKWVKFSRHNVGKSLIDFSQAKTFPYDKVINGKTISQIQANFRRAQSKKF